jgi:hypothetical protein
VPLALLVSGSLRARGSAGFARSVFVGPMLFPGIFLELSGATISVPLPGIPRCSSAGAAAEDESAARNPSADSAAFAAA